mmetsp:Transcript_43142/g.49592  ORF Transcript_43142/g.49592 Transcript_43142/m.49592 type:complete len:311 (-) Transcript_43142:243-1175(-)
MDSGSETPTLIDRHMVKVVADQDDVPKRRVNIFFWNALADQLSLDFPAVNQHVLEWNFRKSLIRDEMLRFPQDIICLCEIDHFADFIEPLLKEKHFEGMFMKKPEWHLDGSAFFYNKDRFELIDSAQQEYKEANQLYITALLRDRTCEDNNNLLLVATTHLKAKAYHGHDDIRVRECQELLEFLGKHNREASRRYIDETATSGLIPTIVCGDFNSEPSGDVYKTMKTNELGFYSSYFNTLVPGAEPKYTTHKIRKNLQSHTIDYIWHTKSNIKTLEVLGIPTEEEIGERALPSEHYPSDHFSVGAVLEFI